MAKGSFSTKNLLLNAAVVLVGLALALLSSVRHAHWGPEGPVGGWLLLVPYLLMAAAVTAVLIALGTFSWVPGGRLTVFLHLGWTSGRFRGVGLLLDVRFRIKV